MTFFDFLLICFYGSIVLAVGIGFYEIIAMKGRARGYGPGAQIGGRPCANGTINCVSVDAPTIMGPLSFEYKLSLFTAGDNVTGKYQYRKKLGNYRGAVYLSWRRNQVKGRSEMEGIRIAEGTADARGVRLIRGFPKGSLLRFLNGPLEFSIKSGKVHFEKTLRAGNIGKDSELRIGGGRIEGRVFHGPQRTWAVDVDIAYQGIKDEIAALAVILACDDILRFHHD